MEGSHYVQGKQEMDVIAESMEEVQLCACFNSIGTNKYGHCFVQSTQLQFLFHAADPNLDLIIVA